MTNVKAIRQRGYGAPGKVLRLEEVERPVPADDEVLVRVYASSVNSIDCRLARATPFVVRLMGGLRAPSNPAFGRDAAGVAEEVGKAVTDVAVGDEVFGARVGAFGEYVAGKNFVRKPANLSFEQAAAMPIASLTALQAVRDSGHVGPGDRVVINGAGGGVGTFAVQLAKALGAHVTGVTAADKVKLVKDAGADEVIDRRTTDYTRPAKYDVIVDCGGDRSLSANLRALTAGGRFVVVGAHKGVLRKAMYGSLRRRLLKQSIVFVQATVNRSDLETVHAMVEAGDVMPVIDRVFPLDRAAQAVAYAETHQASGKVVVSVVPAERD